MAVYVVVEKTSAHHNIDLFRRADKYQMQCDCGWRGKELDYDASRAEGRDHLKNPPPRLQFTVCPTIDKLRDTLTVRAQQKLGRRGRTG